MIGFKQKYLRIALFSGIALTSFASQAQERKEESVPFGDMNKWMVRVVEESFIIGGNTRYLYEISSGDTLKDNTPYVNTVSPWATSSVLARVNGVTKGSVTIFPEKRGDGYCARLETRMENVKVLGLINISVIATGTIFLGKVIEPIQDTKNPQSKLCTGIPFTKRPTALALDYKVTPGGHQVKATGFSRIIDLPNQNQAEACLLLQNRWEDAAGNLYAKRIGTAYEQYGKNVTEWQNNHQIPVHYGNITSQPFFKPYMGLVKGEHTQYCENSKGIMVPVKEVGWGAPNEKITHIVLRLSSGNGGAYIGAPDSKFWVDNVKLVY